MNDSDSLCDFSLTFSQLSGTCQDQYIAALSANIDQFFLIVMGICVYFMQCGFAFLECGSVSSKNVTNVLTMNFVESLLAGVSYWIIGFPLAFGDKADWAGNVFIGRIYWCSKDLSPGSYAFWYFEYVFAATSSTIVKGAAAERLDFCGYMIYSFLMTGFIYPVISHWIWSPHGWLVVGATYNLDGDVVKIGHHDFAGSGVVHITGGVAALLAAVTLGPRIGRFTNREGEKSHQSGHSVPHCCLGALILVFGFFAFNGGSQLSITKPGDGAAVSRAVKNTALSACFAGVSGLFLNRLPCVKGAWSLLTTINATLAGCVAICAGCNVYQPWSAAVVGAFAAVFYTAWSRLIELFKIDDPVDAIAVHLGGGLWGVIAVALFHNELGVFLFWHRASGLLFGWQMAGIAAVALWTGIICAILFPILRFLGVWRINASIEKRG